jgi:hypothetical protein
MTFKVACRLHEEMLSRCYGSVDRFFNGINGEKPGAHSINPRVQNGAGKEKINAALKRRN